MPITSEEIAIQKEVLRDKIFDILKGWILDGTVLPGERLVESLLAKKLQVSRAPLREALWLLSHRGLVTIRAHQGAFVAKLSSRDIRETFEVRETLETYAARRVHATLTDAGRVRLREDLKRLEDAARKRDIAAFTEADFQFHKTLWALAGNRQLEEILVWISSRFFGYQLVRDVHEPAFKFDEMFEEHRRIVELVEAGDDQAIECGLKEIFRTFLDYVLARFGEAEESVVRPPARNSTALGTRN